ncbi:MAG: peroxiredoxin family protein [Anaerolineae bacterium]
MPIKRLIILCVVAVMVAACRSEQVPTPSPASEPTATIALLTGFDPTDPEIVFGDDALQTSPLFQIPQPEALASVASLADMPGNIAAGEPAPDFEAIRLDGKRFTLAAQRGTPTLMIPTALGCSECVTNLRNLAEIYPDYRGQGLEVLIVDLVVEDSPEVWRRFADYLAEPAFIWSVAASPQFAVDYDILSLGTVMLVDADGRLVFRSDNLLSADSFRQLLELAVIPAVSASTPRIGDSITIVPPTPTPLPSATPIPPTPEPTATPEPAGFAVVPNNVTEGETVAVDFNINSISGETIALSDLQGSYVLLLPTVPGCGECMINLNILDQVYPDFRGQGIQVILLDLYPENSPGYWEFLAGNFREPEYIWGVVDTDSFVVDYEIATLGTIMMIDPDGKVVYRSENLIPTETFRRLFETAVSP